MEDGRADANQSGRQKEPSEGGSYGEKKQARECGGHAYRKSVGARSAVSEIADDRLKERRGDLIGEGDVADLSEVQMKGAFEDRIDRRQERLHHVVEEMAEAGCGEHTDERSGLRSGCRCLDGDGRGLAHVSRVARLMGRWSIRDESFSGGLVAGRIAFFPGAWVDWIILPFLTAAYEKHDEAEDEHD